MRDGSADGEQGEAGAGSSPTLSQAEDAGASGPAPQGAPQRRTTEAGPQRAVSNSEAQGSGRGAKPSCGLVHLNKAFVELHFAGQGLPQTVWVQVNVDGRDFSVRLPGQVRRGGGCRAAALTPACFLGRLSVHGGLIQLLFRHIPYSSAGLLHSK
jgi:hypothetical protein